MRSIRQSIGGFTRCHVTSVRHYFCSLFIIQDRRCGFIMPSWRAWASDVSPCKSHISQEKPMVEHKRLSVALGNAVTTSS